MHLSVVQVVGAKTARIFEFTVPIRRFALFSLYKPRSKSLGRVVFRQNHVCWFVSCLLIY